MTWLLQLIGLGSSVFQSIDKLTAAISNQRIAAINAKTEEERIQANERLSMLQAQRDVLIASSQRSSIDLWIRVAAAVGPIALSWKLLVYDKALGQWTQGHTDKLSSLDMWLVTAAFGFFFVTSVFKNK